jgi:hypothetical protein
VTQKRVARPPKGPAEQKDDREKALAVLATVGVAPNDPRIAHLGNFYLKIAGFVEEQKAPDAKAQDDYRKIARALERVNLTTDSGKRIRDCFLRDLKGETLTVAEIKSGRTRAAILKPSEKIKLGRPVDLAIGRTIRDFGDVHGWNWQVCAAAVFLSDVSTFTYAAFKKSFGAWNRRHTS